MAQVPQATTQGTRQFSTGLTVEVALGNTVMAGCQAGQRTHQRPGREGSQHQRQGQGGRQPQAAVQAHQRQQQQGQAGRRHQRPAQVVQHLPAVDGAQRVAARLQQERQQLPVAPRPAVQARRRHVGVKWRVFQYGDVGNHGTSRQRAFQQVVAENLVVGQSVAQHGVHGLNVQQALAAEAAFAEKVLIHLGTCRAVRVDATLPGKQPVKGRGLLGQRCRHPRLQNAPAVQHLALAGVQPRAVLWVRGNRHQFTQAPGRQFGVAVQRNHVGRVRGQLRQLAQIDETGR